MLSVDGIALPDTGYCQLSVDGVCVLKLSGTSLSDDEAGYIHGMYVTATLSQVSEPAHDTNTQAEA